MWPTKRSDGRYSYIGSFGCDEYRTMNTINDMKHSGTQAKHGQQSNEGKMLKNQLRTGENNIATSTATKQN